MARSNEYILILIAASLSFSLAACEQQLPSMNGERWQNGRVLVKFKEGADPASVAEVRSAVGTAGYEKLPLVGVDALFFESSVDVKEAIEGIGVWSELVEYAEPDFLHEKASVPSDFYAGLMWGLTRIQAPLAWDGTMGSNAVVIAVIDTGVDTNHPGLSANIWRNAAEIAGNGIDDDNNGYRDDVRGWDFVENDPVPNDEDAHGTHVAGTIGAVGSNGSGIVGVSPNVRIMALRTLSPYGGATSDNIKAIDYARRNGARVINASWGSYGYSNALRDAIGRAGQQGILFVAAAGNGDPYGRGMNADAAPMYPAGYDLPNILSVAASGGSDKLASFSNYGAATVDLAAPGVQIASTVPGGDYAYMGGTSMASPHVAGAAALLLAASPALTVSRLKDILLDTVDPVADLSGAMVTGGRLNVNRAVVAALPSADPTPTPPPENSWSWESATGGSAHPYVDDFDASWTATEPGASEIKLRFSRISTEAGYDYVILYDGADNEVARYDGEKGALETVTVPGDTIRIRLITDESIQGYGFEVSDFGWR